MYGIFQSIRRRAIKRRFVAFWICLVAIELLCPVLCSPADSAGLASNSSETDIVVSRDANYGTTAASMSACDHEGEKGESADCVDECLCHAVAIPVIAVENKSVAVISDPIAGHYTTSESNSLPPPYLPPKFS